MNDVALFAVGCGVMFLFLSGGYVLFRASFSRSSMDREGVTPSGPTAPGGERP